MACETQGTSQNSALDVSTAGAKRIADSVDERAWCPCKVLCKILHGRLVGVDSCGVWGRSPILPCHASSPFGPHRRPLFVNVLFTNYRIVLWKYYVNPLMWGFKTAAAPPSRSAAWSA